MSLLSHTFHAILMMALLVVDTSIVPAAAVAFAEFDGEHEVLVIPKAGHLEVVLHHREGHETLRPSDHATLMGHFLCELSSLNQENDHEFGFSSSNNPARFERRVAIRSHHLFSWVPPLNGISALPLSQEFPLFPSVTHAFAGDLGRLEAMLRTPQQSHGAMSLLL